MTGSWLKRAFKKGRDIQFSAKLAPEEPFFAIGDIHGNLQALEALFERLDGREPKTAICVGDYVDRGDESAGVLARVHQLNTEYPQNFICLQGNHEVMLLDFLDDPEEAGERWLRFGGLQTLMSYHVTRGPGDTLTDVRNRLKLAMGDALIGWLRDLPLKWQSGNVVVTHAGMNPERPVATQSERSLLWGHPNFRKLPRADGIWVVHGHVIVDAPTAENGVISIDTGAYATNRLTAAEVGPESLNFIHS